MTSIVGLLGRPRRRPGTIRAAANPLWGRLLSPRHDVPGASWLARPAGFLRWGRSALLVEGAVLALTFLEVDGSSTGTRAWHGGDPMGHSPVGNPPGGAALSRPVAVTRRWLHGIQVWREQSTALAHRLGIQPHDHVSDRTLRPLAPASGLPLSPGRGSGPATPLAPGG